jgi:hypothetical protein
METDIVFKDESYTIIGACFEVYKEMGCGFLEAVYQECLSIEFVVEIKAVRCLVDEHRAQVINYLKATGMQLGLLINFGHYPKIEHERFVNQSFSRLSRVS